MANFNFNKVIIGGRLTADPELKTTPSGVSVTSFTVAVNRNYRSKSGEEPQADFINVTAWSQTRGVYFTLFQKGKLYLHRRLDPDEKLDRQPGSEALFHRSSCG